MDTVSFVSDKILKGRIINILDNFTKIANTTPQDEPLIVEVALENYNPVLYRPQPKQRSAPYNPYGFRKTY